MSVSYTHLDVYKRQGHEKYISLDVGQVDYPGDSQIVKEALERIYYKGEDEDEL